MTLALTGSVGFVTYPAVRERLEAFVALGGGEVDWSGVEQVDSSALALVLQTRRSASSQRIEVSHTALPAALLALAELYGVAQFIEGAPFS